MLVHDVVPGREGAPIAVVLHGLGDSRQGWKPIAPMLDLDGWGWCFVQAPDPYGPGWSWFDLDLGEKLSVDAAGVRRSHRELLALLAHLETARGVPCERIALIGFSQGCLMVLETVLRHPRPFLAAVGISGWLHREDEWPAAFGAALPRQRLLVTHGRHDPVIPMHLAAPRIAHLRRLGVPLAWAEYDKDHTLDPYEEAADIRRHLLDAAAAPQQGAGPGAHA
ncbi:MAG: alpha/beta fold hydrolase [Planctomycetes bacterium]|nr:alpha/beta fold hydrolase [Planctomycetota bacterium]